VSSLVLSLSLCDVRSTQSMRLNSVIRSHLAVGLFTGIIHPFSDTRLCSLAGAFPLLVRIVIRRRSQSRVVERPTFLSVHPPSDLPGPRRPCVPHFH